MHSGISKRESKSGIQLNADLNSVKEDDIKNKMAKATLSC
jgi:hypothetical protein